MELFLPSLFVLLLAVLVILYVIPQQSGFVLGVIAVALLAMTIYQHISLFSMDYDRMTWVDTVKQQAPFIMVIAVVIVLIGYVILLVGKGSGPVTNIQNRVNQSYNAPPPASSPRPTNNDRNNNNNARRREEAIRREEDLAQS